MQYCVSRHFVIISGNNMCHWLLPIDRFITSHYLVYIDSYCIDVATYVAIIVIAYDLIGYTVPLKDKAALAHKIVNSST